MNRRSFLHSLLTAAALSVAGIKLSLGLITPTEPVVKAYTFEVCTGNNVFVNAINRAIVDSKAIYSSPSPQP